MINLLRRSHPLSLQTPISTSWAERNRRDSNFDVVGGKKLSFLALSLLCVDWNAAMNQASCRLPRLLALLPRNGVDSLVFQTRWTGKGLPTPSRSAETAEGCYYEVKQVVLKHNPAGKLTAKAFGILFWKGQSASSAVAAPSNPAHDSLHALRETRHRQPAPLRADQGVAEIRLGEQQHSASTPSPPLISRRRIRHSPSHHLLYSHLSPVNSQNLTLP